MSPTIFAPGRCPPIAEHFHEAAVGVVGGYLPVVDDGAIQQGERVCAAPPARRIGGIPPVCRPAIGRIVLQTVEVSHVLREPHRLEHPHIFAAGKNVHTLHLCIDRHDGAGHALLLVYLHGGQYTAQRRHEKTPDQRLIRNGGRLPGGDPLLADDLHRLPQKGFAVFSGGAVIQKHMQGKKIPILRIDPVGREAASQSVGTIVHGLHAFDDCFAGHKMSFSGDHSGDRAAGWDPDLSFDFVHVPTP